jgi:hypothetical protein
MILGRYLTRENLSIIVTAVALAAGVIAGNYFRGAMAWRIDSDRPLNARDLRDALGWSLEGKPSMEPSDADQEKAEAIPIPPSPYWLPWLAGFAILIDLLARFVPLPPSIWSTARTLAAVLAGRLLCPADLRIEYAWAPWALGVIVLMEWALLQSLAERWKDGTLATTLALCLAAAGVIILHAHSGRMTDMALLFSTALVPIALFTWMRPGETGAALGAVAVFLPGLLLNAKHDTFSDVPWRSFLLAATAPLALLPMVHPKLARQTRWGRWLPGVILPLIPATWAVILAAEAERLQF